MWQVLLLIGSTLFLFILWFFVAFRYAKGMRKDIEQVWRKVDLNYRKRHDLLPGLVEFLRMHELDERLVTKALGARDFARRETFPSAKKSSLEKDFGSALREIFNVGGEGARDVNFLEYKSEIIKVESVFADVLEEFNTKVELILTNNNLL